MPVQTQLQQRRGTAASWTSANPTLAAGEIGFESDTNRFKIGNGSTAWASLSYWVQDPVTTKGDLYTFSTTDTRLPVGANGETIVADSAATTGLRYQTAYNGNAVINGGMDIWQRGTSVAGSATGFLADRWRAYRNAAGSTFSRQTSSLTGIQYCLRVQRDNANTFTNGIGTFYTAESADAYRFAGQTITLSFYARAGANFSGASSQMNVGMQTGTGTDQAYGSFTGAVNVISTNQVITTSWVRYSFNATLGSTVSQFALDLSYAPVGTAGAADYFEITGVQLEVGSVATTFKRAGGGSIQGELAACQRYYQVFNRNGIAYVGSAYLTTAAKIGIQFVQTMRTAPTVILGTAGQTTGTFSFLNNSVGYPATTGTHSAQGPTVDGFELDGTGYSASFAAGGANMLYCNGPQNLYTASAEL